MNLFPILLVTHIALAVALLLPSVLLPFALPSRGPAPGQSRFGRLLLWLQANGTLVIGAGLAVTGVGMLLILVRCCSPRPGCGSRCCSTPATC